MKLLKIQKLLASYRICILLTQFSAGNTSISVITYQYFKLARTIALPSTTALMVAHAFLSYWFFPYGIPDYLVLDNGSQIISYLFDIVCASLAPTHMTTTSYHPQTNDQTVSYTRTLVTRLILYVAEH